MCEYDESYQTCIRKLDIDIRYNMLIPHATQEDAGNGRKIQTGEIHISDH